jgi:dTDP-4-dehydrorhamnose 3,5-epimerase
VGYSNSKMHVPVPERSQILIPHCEPGAGRVISTVDSPDLICGVFLSPFELDPCDSGYDVKLVPDRFQDSTAHVLVTFSYCRTIRAFCYYRGNHVLWLPATGMVQVALVDLRIDSPTFGVKNTLYVGSLRPWQLLIPAGVAHGYKAVGESPALVLQLTSGQPGNDGPIPLDDASVAYEWERES